MEAISTELARLGIRCEQGEDSLRIWPGRPVPGVVETYDDHRMAMGFPCLAESRRDYNCGSRVLQKNL